MAHNMAQTFTGRKRIRKFFGHLREVAEMPNLIEVQKASYDQFLLVDEPRGGRPDEGLQAVFKSVFPISDFSNAALLEFVKYEFEPPKYDVDECRQRGMTFAAPIKVACIGEHTTHSHHFPPLNRDTQPVATQEYPAMLQTKLGSGYNVQNFGDCCATVARWSRCSWGWCSPGASPPP